MEEPALSERSEWDLQFLGVDAPPFRPLTMYPRLRAPPSRSKGWGPIRYVVHLHGPHHQRNKLSVLFTATIRVLFTTLLFTAGGMGLGLLLGIIGFVTYGLLAGVQPDMRNAYRHVAIPVAITIGCAGLRGRAGSRSPRPPNARLM